MITHERYTIMVYQATLQDPGAERYARPTAARTAFILARPSAEHKLRERSTGARVAPKARSSPRCEHRGARSCPQWAVACSLVKCRCPLGLAARAVLAARTGTAVANSAGDVLGCVLLAGTGGYNAALGHQRGEVACSPSSWRSRCSVGRPPTFR